MLKPNQLAPLDIEIKDHNDQKTTLRSLLGSYVVLFFYPKDMTPGCTREACSLRDFNAQIEALGAKVIGISRDGIDSHQKFSQKHQLNFKLWSDPDHKLLEAFGVWGEKKFMGKVFLGITRSTFILDPQGKIVHVWAKVKPDNHGEEVYDFLSQVILRSLPIINLLN